MLTNQGNQARMVLASAGFACFLAMNSFSLWGFTLLPQTTLGPDALELWSTPLSCGNALSFFIFVLGAYRAPRLFDRNPLVAAVALLALACILLNGYMVLRVDPLLIVAGTCMGIGTTCCFFCWARTFYHDGLESAKTEIVLGSVLSAVPFLAFLTLDPSAIVFTLSLLAFLNLIALFGHGRIAKSQPSTPPTASVALKTVFGFSWKAFLCIALIGLMAPLVAKLSHAPLVSMEFPQQTLMVHSENICAAIILGIAWLGLKRRLDVVKTFSILFPALITVLLLFPFIGQPARIAVPYVGGVAFVIVSMVVTIESIEVSTDRTVNFTVIYGLYAGLLYLANFLGNVVAGGLDDNALFEETSLTGIMFVLLYSCSIVMFFITRHGIRKKEASDENRAAPLTESTVDAACLDIIAEQKFSERKAEVFSMLAHGYDIPTIAKKLFLSENTVRTHAKKIYAALDVHSKQEIIELVNNPASQKDEEPDIWTLKVKPSKSGSPAYAKPLKHDPVHQ